MQQRQDRMQWALQLLKVEPHHQLLEIGCGSGLLAHLICTGLSTGKLLALDRSVTQLSKAAQKNQQFLQNGKLELIQADFESIALPHDVYDTIVAFNVSSLLHSGSPAIKKVMTLLKKEGRLLVLHQAPWPLSTADAIKLAEELRQNGLHIVGAHFKRFEHNTAIAAEMKLP